MFASAFTTLSQAVSHLNAGSADQARQLLVSMMESTRHGDDLCGMIFASALLKRFDADSHRAPAPVARQSPFAKEAARLANRLLANHLHGHDEATLMDIGIGSGQQVGALLRHMEDTQLLPRKLTVIGVEPVAENLRAAELTVRGVADAVGVELDFIPIAKRIEDLNESEWTQLQALQGTLVINEAFSLHRASRKDDVLHRLRSLQPNAFVLAEPHSDHHTSEFGARFANCWRHFGLAFSAVDQLDLSQLEKSAIKTSFFSREIEDILGSEECRRVERHETAAMWMRRLQRAGFTVQPPAMADTQPPSAGATSVSLRDGYLGLDFGHQTLVAIIQAA
jgi:hypothetical protein